MVIPIVKDITKAVVRTIIPVGSGGAFNWAAYWVTLRSGDIWYRREINYAGGYFILWYSDDAGVTWENLMTLDLTEDSVIIDLAHLYRHRITGTSYYVDQTLTALGYAGVEGTDWENLYNNLDWAAYWATQISAITIVVANSDPTKVVMTFINTLNTTLPDASSFLVVGETVATDGIAVSSITLDGTQKILTLTIASALTYEDNPIVIYVQPTLNPLKSASGSNCPSFIKTGTSTVEMTAEYTTVYNDLTTKPSAGITAYQDFMMSNLVSGGVWADLDSFRYLNQTVNTDNEAVKDWKDVTKIATLHGATAPVFTANAGFTMKKADSRYIDLLWKASEGVNYTLNDACIFIFIATDVNESAYDVGNYDGTYWSQIFRNNTEEALVINGGNGNPFIVDIVGVLVGNRIDATHQEVWHRETLLDTYTDTVQAGLSTNSMWLGARHDPATAQSPSSRTYALIGFGKALTGTKVGILSRTFLQAFNYGKYGNSASAFIQTDFSDSNLASVRAEIIDRIWLGTGVPATGVDSISEGVAEVMASSSANLASIDELTIEIAGINDRLCYVWHPTDSNGKFIIYHHDHFYALTGTDSYEEAGRADLIRALIDEGYTVCRIPMPPGNDGTEGKSHSYPVVAEPYMTVDDLHYFIDSTIRVLNEFEGDYSAYYMVGMSGGGWSTDLAAALDERITKSIQIAGSLPLSGTTLISLARDWEQQLSGLTDLIDYGDLYAMATTSNREKQQYINANEDPIQTGFNLTTYKLAPYITEMAEITSRFKLYWDTTTVEHKISTASRAKAIAFLNE